MLKNFSSKAKSFTLIEILVVVFIIGLLSSLIIVNLNQARAKGRDAKRISDLNTVASALQAYYADNHSYPISLNDSASYTNYIDMVNTLKTSGYLVNCPQDPKIVLKGSACSIGSYPSEYPGFPSQNSSYGYRYQSWSDPVTVCSTAGNCNYYALAAVVELKSSANVDSAQSVTGRPEYRLCNGEPWSTGNCAQ